MNEPHRLEIEYQDGETKRSFDLEINFTTWMDCFGEDADGNRGLMTEDWEIDELLVREDGASVDQETLSDDLLDRINEFADEAVEDFIADGGTGND